LYSSINNSRAIKKRRQERFQKKYKSKNGFGITGFDFRDSYASKQKRKGSSDTGGGTKTSNNTNGMHIFKFSNNSKVGHWSSSDSKPSGNLIDSAGAKSLSSVGSKSDVMEVKVVTPAMAELVGSASDDEKIEDGVGVMQEVLESATNARHVTITSETDNLVVTEL
jgi:hypothetical protein